MVSALLDLGLVVSTPSFQSQEERHGRVPKLFRLQGLLPRHPHYRHASSGQWWGCKIVEPLLPLKGFGSSAAPKTGHLNRAENAGGATFEGPLPQGLDELLFRFSLPLLEFNLCGFGRHAEGHPE